MKPLLCIVGPTAVGKTAIAIEVAERLNAEIISVDSRQIYHGFRIGAAQPRPEETSRVRHHLIDFQSAQEPLTAGKFGQIARDLVIQFEQQNQPILLVGGAGLYFSAIFGELFPSPPVDTNIRNQLRKRKVTEGIAALHSELLRIDPEVGQTIHPNDYPRIERALEVFLTSGKKISQFWTEQDVSSFPFFPFTIGISRSRQEIVDRIEKRTMKLLELGWIDEVRFLIEHGYSEAIELIKFHGYREIASYLKGNLSYQEMISEINRVTRQYAKRQVTWFHHHLNTQWIPIQETSQLSETADLIVQLYREKIRE